MSILDLHTDEFTASATALPVLPAPPKPSPKFSIWGALTAAPKGLAAAGAERTGFLADVAGAFGQVMGAYPEAMGPGVQLDATQRKQADEARTKLLTQGIDFSSEPGDLFRNVARDYRPDAETGHAAEQVLFGLTRTLGKVVGDVATMGPAGALVSGVDEASMVASDLKAQGVGLQQRTEAGLVQGGFMALGAVLPLAGQTLKQTAALYFAGGPGSFMAGQALTRKILEADTPQAAAQFDPFDPLGLALSALIPLPFAHYGLKANRAAQAEGFRAGPVPSEPTAVARGVAEAFTPTAEQVDAARVQALVEQRRGASLADPGDMAGATRHADALARAEDQLAAGERVNVDPGFITQVPDGMAAIVSGASKAADSIPIPGWDAPADRSVSALPPPAQVADDLRAMAGAAYWMQEGGQLLRTGIDTAGDGGMGGEVSGRTPWVPAAEWFGRMRSQLGRDGLTRQADIAAAVEKAINGESLRAAERRTVDWIRMEQAEMRSQLAKSEWIDPGDVGNLAGDSFEAGLSRADAPDVAKVARAAELDEAAFERAAIQYENDDAGFMRAIQEIIDASPDQAPGNASAGPGASGAGARSAQDAGGTGPTGRTGDAGPAGGADGGRGTGAADSAAAADAQRLTAVAQQFPDLEVMLDGMDRPQRLSEFLAAVKAEADAEIADAPLFQVAAECALINGL
jgi:hypothetical protein